MIEDHQKVEQVHNEVLGIMAMNLPAGSKTTWDFNEVVRLMSIAYLKGEGNVLKLIVADMTQTRDEWRREREAISG